MINLNAFVSSCACPRPHAHPYHYYHHHCHRHLHHPNQNCEAHHPKTPSHLAIAQTCVQNRLLPVLEAVGPAHRNGVVGRLLSRIRRERKYPIRCCEQDHADAAPEGGIDHLRYRNRRRGERRCGWMSRLAHDVFCELGVGKGDLVLQGRS